jgi:hypothetical protein
MLLDGKGRIHGQHNTGFDTKTKRKKVCCNNKLWGQIKNAIHMIATSEDWKNDINGKVA